MFQLQNANNVYVYSWVLKRNMIRKENIRKQTWKVTGGELKGTDIHTKSIVPVKFNTYVNLKNSHNLKVESYILFGGNF